MSKIPDMEDLESRGGFSEEELKDNRPNTHGDVQERIKKVVDPNNRAPLGWGE